MWMTTFSSPPVVRTSRTPDRLTKLSHVSVPLPIFLPHYKISLSGNKSIIAESFRSSYINNCHLCTYSYKLKILKYARNPNQISSATENYSLAKTCEFKGPT